MGLGHIVAYGGCRWRICKLDRGVRTVTLVGWGGATKEVADDDPGIVSVADPSGWPVVTAKMKPNSGQLVKLALARRGKLEELRPLTDWVPSDLLRAGGSVFMNPELKLAVGEVLIAGYKDGSASRILITKRYGSIAQRKVARS